MATGREYATGSEILIEGMAAGCAVVASDLAAFRAVAGEGAVLVEPGDAAALSSALASLLGDGALAHSVAEMGSRVVDRYDWAGVTGAYIDAYREALAVSS